MSISITPYIQRINVGAKIEAEADRNIEAVAQQILADSTRFVPKSAGSSQSSGHLRESGRVVTVGPCARNLVWSAPYAAYQWFGVRADGTHKVQHYTTPGTGKMWVKTAEKMFGDRWKKIAAGGKA